MSEPNSPCAEQENDGSAESESSEVAELESKVHSANDWEHADLGDKGRKEKFLKLMGASKTEHKGKIVIGEKKPQHKADDPDKMNKDLEDQFHQGLEHKLKSGRRHLGLGYSSESTDQLNERGDTPSVDTKPDTDVEEKAEDPNNGDGKEEPVTEWPPAEKRKSCDGTEDDPVVKKKKSMMNFVKSSD